MLDTDRMTEIAPGAYVDTDGTFHIDTAAMCAAAGYEPTEENQAMLERAARDMLEKEGTTVVTED